MPEAVLVFGAKCDCGSFACVGYGIVGEIAEHAVEQALIAFHPDACRQEIAEGHVLILHLQSRFLGNVVHGKRYVYRFEALHFGGIVQLVECGYVLE